MAPYRTVARGGPATSHAGSAATTNHGAAGLKLDVAPNEKYDRKAAFQLFRQAAEKNGPLAAVLVGNIYRGLGVARDLDAGEKWVNKGLNAVRKLAKNNDPTAMWKRTRKRPWPGSARQPR